MEGIIIKNISNDYTVRTNNNDLVVCKPRGKFRNSKLTPLVGDKVVCCQEYCNKRKRNNNRLDNQLGAVV